MRENNSQTSRCSMIAEIGVNHNGELGLAIQMIDAAKKSGADAVKFQTFCAERIVTGSARKAAYHQRNTSSEETHLEMLRALELSYEHHYEIKQYCCEKDIEFLSTPYDVESVEFLESLGVQRYKTASADITDLQLHASIRGTGKPVLIATGMSTLAEVDQIVGFYKQDGGGGISLLQCVSNYPCSLASLNLSVLKTFSDRYSVPVGFSDHTIGSEAALVAVALGAGVIEKHFTLDKSMPGPDHGASSTPSEFKAMVDRVRRAETILGDGIKKCQDEEKDNASVSRKSVTIKTEVRANEILDSHHLTMKRPGTGLPASEIGSILGRKARVDLAEDYQLTLDDLLSDD